MKKKLKLLYFLFLKNAKSLNDDKLGAKLRARVHGIEKQGKDEETSDFASLIWGRQLYHEAKKREILSNEELMWCKNVLFGKTIIKTFQTDSEKNDEPLFKIIKERRSIRSWEDNGITDDEFATLIDAAKWAPSSSHRQTWHFLLTRDKEKINTISQIRKQKFVKNAPSCILVLININAYKKLESVYTPYLDAGAAIQNMLLMAHTLGLGACWVNFGEYEIPDSKNMQKIKNLFQIPENLKIVSIIPIGKLSAKNQNAPGRKATKDIIHIERF